MQCVCVWLGLGGRCVGDWVRGLGLGFTNLVGTGVGRCYVCVSLGSLCSW